MMNTNMACVDMVHGAKLQSIIDDVAKIGWTMKVSDYPDSVGVWVEFELKTPIEIDYSVIVEGSERVVDKLFDTFANFYADDYVQNMCIYYANESMPCTITEALKNGRFIGDKLEALLRYFNGGEIDIKHHGDRAALTLDEMEKAHNEYIAICGNDPLRDFIKQEVPFRLRDVLGCDEKLITPELVDRLVTELYDNSDVMFNYDKIDEWLEEKVGAEKQDG